MSYTAAEASTIAPARGPHAAAARTTSVSDGISASAPSASGTTRLAGPTDNRDGWWVKLVHDAETICPLVWRG